MQYTESNGRQQFTFAMFYNEEAVLMWRPVLWLTESLSIMFFDRGDMPLAELDGLIEEVRTGLEDRLGVSLCRRISRKSVCEEQKAPLLRYKARFHPDMEKTFRESGHFLPETFHVLFDLAKGRPHLRADNFTNHLKKITGRSDAFEVMLFYKPDPKVRGQRILDIGNEADSGIVVMNLYGGNGLSDEDVGRLASEAKDALKARFGEPFCRANLETNLCDAEHARQEDAREALSEGDGNGVTAVAG